jgi:repressor LexA
MKNDLTKIQKDILNFLIDQIKGKGIPPTLAEVANHFGYRNRATVQQHFGAIERKGYIKKNPKLSRGIELTLEDKFLSRSPFLGKLQPVIRLQFIPMQLIQLNFPQ